MDTVLGVRKKLIAAAKMIPSVTGALRKIHFDIKREQPIEQGHLAIVMPRCESAVGDLFTTVLQQSEPQQRTQDSRLHGVGRSVPRPRQYGRLRDGAQPRQLLAGLPAVRGN